jgi:hypothetical protein
VEELPCARRLADRPRLAYLTLALLTSIVAFTVAVTGFAVSLSLACFVVGLPVILVTAWAFRRTADLGRLSVAIAGRRPPARRPLRRPSRGALPRPPRRHPPRPPDLA